MQAALVEQAGGPAAPAYVVRVQGLSPEVDVEQLQRHAAAAFGAVLAAEVLPSERDRPTGAGTVVFASLDAALQAAAYWQGPCELGDAVTAQFTSRTGQQAQQAQQAQPHWPQRQHDADAPSQRAPRSPLRKRPTPKPAIVVRGLLPATTAETLYSVFGPAGPIKRLRVVVDEQGHSAGVAFITFQTLDGVRRALQLGEGIVIDGQRPTVGPAHREADPEEQAQRTQQAQHAEHAQQAAGECQPPHNPMQLQQQQAQQHAQQQAQQRAQQQAQQRAQQQAQEQAQQALAAAGPDARLGQRRGSFSGLPASGPGWEVSLQRAGSSPALSGLGGGPSSPGGLLGTLSSSSGEASSTDTLFARPLAPEVDESALRDLFGEHAGVLSTRVLRLPDGTSRGCGFVRFADPSQALLALQALNGAQLSGRSLRLSWAHPRQPQHSRSSSVDAGARPRSFGPSSSGDFSPGASRLASPVAPMGMVPMMAASPGYTPIMMSPVYWPAGGMYAAPAVPAMPQAALPPGSPLGSPVPGSPVIGSPYQFAQPVAGFAQMPAAALPPPALPLDPSSPVQGWAAQRPQWPAHWQPMPQLAAGGGGGGVPWLSGFQFGRAGGPGWQWQAQQAGGGLNFLWDGTTIPGAAGAGAAAPAAPGDAARTPAAAPAPAPATFSSPSSGGEASVGSAVAAAPAGFSSPDEGPSPAHGLGQQMRHSSTSPPDSPTPDESSRDEWAPLHGSSAGSSAQPSSSQLQPSDTEEQPATLTDAAAAQRADSGDGAAEAAAGSLEQLRLS